MTTETLDPFAPWATHDSQTCTACAVHGTVEQYDLAERVAELALLVPEPGHWANPASLTRFGTSEMDMYQLKRFLKKIKPVQIDWHTPCWLWDGGTHDKGYGRFYLGPVNNKRVIAYSHRISFEHWIGFPPRGYIVDHQCNHKLCCNPTHLWPETNNENLRKAEQRRPWKRRNQYSEE